MQTPEKASPYVTGCGTWVRQGRAYSGRKNPTLIIRPLLRRDHLSLRKGKLIEIRSIILCRKFLCPTHIHKGTMGIKRSYVAHPIHQTFLGGFKCQKTSTLLSFPMTRKETHSLRYHGIGFYPVPKKPQSPPKGNTVTPQSKSGQMRIVNLSIVTFPYKGCFHFNHSNLQLTCLQSPKEKSPSHRRTRDSRWWSVKIVFVRLHQKTNGGRVQSVPTITVLLAITAGTPPTMTNALLVKQRRTVTHFWNCVKKTWGRKIQSITGIGLTQDVLRNTFRLGRNRGTYFHFHQFTRSSK